MLSATRAKPRLAPLAWAAALALAAGLSGCVLPPAPDRARRPAAPGEPAAPSVACLPAAQRSGAQACPAADSAFARGLAAWRSRAGDADAIRWFRHAAAQGNGAAAYFVSIGYAEGRGVRRDPAKAGSWLKRAAALGDARAEYFVGLGYTNGRARTGGGGDGLAVPRNDAIAARWYGKAADQGNAPGQYMLGLSYALGWGLPEDEVAAYKWLWLAAKAKYGPAEGALATLGPRLTVLQRAHAAAMARAWRPQPPGTFADPPTVRFVQMTLARLDFDPGPIDGKFGPRTEGAIAAYETSLGEHGSGHLTAKVLKRLEAAAEQPIAKRKQAFEGVW